MNSESTLHDALSEVDTALAASDNERAAGLASELLLAYPNAVTVLRQRARALSAAGRALQAAEVQRRVLEILPADAEAMAGLARALQAAGQHAEAADAARQALDYAPGDDFLKRIAAGETQPNQPFQPSDASLQLRKSLAETRVGILHRGIPGLRLAIAKLPDRIDALVALMQALWENKERIAAAELAQAVLDDFPSCLNANLLMLKMWRAAGTSEMERIHLQAIDQVDPDHRATRALLGAQSPLVIVDVPARPAQPAEPASEEDAQTREAWVASLMAVSTVLPKPLEQQREPDADASESAVDESAADASDELDFVSTLLPLEWSAASDLSEEAAQDDFSVSWISGDVKDEFAPARPATTTPDPRDGVPEELPALEWEGAGDESAAPAQKDFRTAVDGGAISHADAPAEAGSEPPAAAPVEKESHPLKPLAFAGVVAAAANRLAGDAEAQPAAQDAGEASPPNAETSAAQAMRTEVESAALKPLPIDAIESGEPENLPLAPAQKTPDTLAETTPPENVIANQASPQETSVAPEEMPEMAAAPVAAATLIETPVASVEAAAGEAAPAAGAPPQQEIAPAPVTPAPEAESQDGSLVKAMAVATAVGAAVKKRQKKAVEKTKTIEPAAAAEAPAAEQPIAPEPQGAAVVAAPAGSEIVKPAEITQPAQPEVAPEAMAPAETNGKPKPKATSKPKGKSAEPTAAKATQEKPSGKTEQKPAKKPVKKPAGKPAALATQTEKVRKAYERAITTAKREDMPKLIGELNQAAERDPDNKIIFELLGQAYNRSGDIPAAINAYRKALELAEHA